VSCCDCEVDLASVVATVIVIIVYIVVAGIWGLAGFRILLLIMLVLHLIGLGYWIARWNHEGGCYCRSYGDMILDTIAEIVLIATLCYLLS